MTLASFIRFLRHSKKQIYLIIAVVAITLLLSAALYILLERFANVHLPSIGNVHTIGVEAYGGDIKTAPDGTKYLDWGTIYPGAPIYRSFYLHSISNVPTTLKNETRTWIFKDSNGNTVNEPLAQYMHPTWNYNNTVIQPNETIYITLTLKPEPDPIFIQTLINYDVKTFSFDIIITANPT
jgi:hypothetical protein